MTVTENLTVSKTTPVQVQLRRFARTAMLYAAVALIVVVMIGPVIWTLITSISPQVELLLIPPHWIPDNPSLKGYERLIDPTETGLLPAVYTFRRSMINSLVIALGSTTLSLILGCPAAYSFARMRFRGKTSTFYVIIFTQMLPSISLLIPLYLIFVRLNLIDTLEGLILLYTTFTLPFVIWVMRNYFLTIPRDLEDAAMVDGCSRIAALFRVVMPLAIPGLVATGIFSFLNAWGEFLLAVVFTNTPASKTLTVTISEFAGTYTIDYQLMAAAGILASIPPIFIALFLTDLLVKGLTEGGVKG